MIVYVLPQDKWRNPVTSSLCSSLEAGLESHWLTFPFEGVSGLTGLPSGAVTPRLHGDAYTPKPSLATSEDSPSLRGIGGGA